jgi:hypothetical protein
MINNNTIHQAYKEYAKDKLSGYKVAMKHGIPYPTFLKYIKSKKTKALSSDTKVIQMTINGNSLSFNNDILKDIISSLK